MKRLSRSGSLASVAFCGALIAACSGTNTTSGFLPTSFDGANDGGTEGTGVFTGGAGNSGGGNGSSDAGVASGDAAIDTTPPCDTGLAIDDSNAASFAKAIGICTTVAAQGYGLVSASYSKGYGSTEAPHAGQWGLLPKFGDVIVPREGSSIGVLSSGYARDYDDSQNQVLGQSDPFGDEPGTDSDFVDSSPDGPLDGMNYPTGIAPPGYPKAASGCQQSSKVNDMIDVKLVLKAPPGATGFQFDFDFYSSEWPNFVCSEFNDAFVAYVTSNESKGNVSFDSNNNPVAVNVNFFNRCTPNAPVGCLRSNSGFPEAPISTSTCSGGVSELGGTGYADTYSTQCCDGSDPSCTDVNATLGGATGWLTTLAPIAAGEQFTLEFMIWDAGDGLLDSSVLIDHFQWIGGTTVSGPTTQRPPR